jgi:hypothetical protein
MLYILLLLSYIYSLTVNFVKESCFSKLQISTTSCQHKMRNIKKEDGNKCEGISYMKANSQRTQLEISSVCVCVSKCVTSLNLPSLCSEWYRRFCLINLLALVGFPDFRRGMHTHKHTLTYTCAQNLWKILATHTF